MTMNDSLQSKYEANGGKSALPWADIIAAIMQLLPAICPAKRAKAWAKLFPDATEHMINNHLKSSIKNASDRDAATQAIYDVFVSTSDKTIESMR